MAVSYLVHGLTCARVSTTLVLSTLLLTVKSQVLVRGALWLAVV